MHTVLRNIATWEVATLTKENGGTVTADMVDHLGHRTRCLGFMSVAEARSWFRADGGWKAKE
ncbi:MAG: hypothetical protein KAJ19_08730 [Gammaproteobacteria bacterium]|nr:hypothetical protein [Gammaproteobacteria bacterium]